MYRKNVSGQHLPFALVNASTGAALTGATVTGRRSIDGGAQANVTGTISELGNGQYNLALSQADINGNQVGFLFTATGAIPVHITVLTTAADPTDAAGFGLSRIDAAVSTRASQSSVDAIDDFLDTEIAAILADTNELQADWADGGRLDLILDARASQASVDTLDDYVDTEVAAIKAKTDNLPASPAATSDIPSAGAIADAVWDEAQSGHTTAGTFGKYLDTEVSGVGGGSLTAADIADAVWDETLADHLTAGSTGAGLNAAGSAGDPWATALPGAYGAGSAGKILGDNLNATVSSRASQASVDAVDDYIDTEVAAIKAKTDNLPASPAAVSDIPTAAAIRAEIDSNSTKLDAAVSTRSSHSAADVWAVATRALTDKAGFSLSSAGIQAIWDALTSALTTASSIGKLLVDNINATISSRLASAGYTAPDNTGIAAIQAKTDNLPASPAATSDIPTADQNADALLDRTDGVETSWTLRQAIRVVLASVAGKLSGAATTTVTIRNPGDSKNRITATVDADGNRSAVSYDKT